MAGSDRIAIGLQCYDCNRILKSNFKAEPGTSASVTPTLIYLNTKSSSQAI